MLKTIDAKIFLGVWQPMRLQQLVNFTTEELKLFDLALQKPWPLLKPSRMTRQ